MAKKFLLVVHHDWLEESGPYPVSQPFDTVREAEAAAKKIHDECFDDRYTLTFKLWEIREDYSVQPLSEFCFSSGGTLEHCDTDITTAEEYLEIFKAAE